MKRRIWIAIARWALRTYVGDRPKHSAMYLHAAARDAGALGCRQVELFFRKRARLADLYERLDRT